MTVDFKGIAHRYFEAFSSKDLNVLTGMFADDVTLKDWEIEANGKQSVIQAIKKIFDSVETINVRVLRLIIESNVIAAELEISMDTNTIIDVVDLIVISSNGLITEITAFKG